MPLCQYCNALDAYEMVRRGSPQYFLEANASSINLRHFTRHHSSLAELQQCVSGQQPCDLCRLFLLNWFVSARAQMMGQSLTRLPNEDDTSWLQRSLASRMKKRPGGALFVSATHPPLSAGRIWDRLPGLSLWQSKPGKDQINTFNDLMGQAEFFFDRSSLPDSGVEHIWMRNIYENPNAQECIKLASEWLQDCLNNHTECQKYLGRSNALPTRIIDLHGNGVEPRLYITRGEPENYVALSYCWGQDTNLKLLSENLDRFWEQIRYSECPKTIQDAIILTKAVGIRYLWVDALCIIQESRLHGRFVLTPQSSENDWAFEAARMNNVYSNATLTLSAANASSAQEGFFKLRDLSTQCSLPWRAAGSPLTEAESEVFLRVDRVTKHDADHNFDSWPQGTWPTRGWTLQEYLVTGRGLTFTKLQMNWHCLSVISRENGDHVDLRPGEQDALSVPMKGRHLSRLTDFTRVWALLTRLHDRHIEQLPPQIYGTILADQFYVLTNHYRYRSFTFRSDKLAATAGVARTVEGLLSARGCPARYWAGLWDNYLAEGLAWAVYFTEHPDHDRPYDKQRSASIPSWSWASVVEHTYVLEAAPWDAGKTKATRSLVRNAQIQGAVNDQARFIPRMQLVLRITVPFQRLSDDLMRSDSGTDGSRPVIPALEKLLRKKPIGIGFGDSWLGSPVGKYKNRQKRSEFSQKHCPFPGQKFALIQVIAGERSDEALYGRFLLLESVPEHDNRYRRVDSLELSTMISPGNGYELIAPEVLEMIKNDPWLAQEVDIV